MHGIHCSLFSINYSLSESVLQLKAHCLALRFTNCLNNSKSVCLLLTLSIISAWAIDRCFLDEVDFQGADMPGNPRRNLASVEDCINICNTVNGCKGLTFKADAKKCWLKSILFTPQTDGYLTNYDYVTGSLNMDCLYGKPVKKEQLSFKMSIL